MKTVRFTCAGLAILLMVALNALAGSQSPHEFVSKTTQAALAQLRTHKAQIESDPSVLEKIITDYILPHMDFVSMSKLVLKSNWKKASETQRKLFTQEFKNLLVRTYAKSLGEYSSEGIEFLPYQPGSAPEKLALIKSQVVRAGSENILIDYRLRYKKSDGWKVYDISIEGVSLIKNYQGSFAREISQNGIDKLIESLQKKNNQSGN